MIASYKILERLGSGYSGTVYKAIQISLDRVVAVKVFKKSEDDRLWERFRLEALTLAKLNHPHVLEIYESNLENDPPFLVTPFYEKGSLSEVVGQNFSSEEILDWGFQLVKALECLHQQKLIHRDLKPANIFLTESTEGTKLILGDFGLAAYGKSGLTGTGNVVGTIPYMAPEVLVEGEYSPASDYFSLGKTLLELALRKRLRKTMGVSKKLIEKIEEVDNQTLRTLIRKCLEEDPKARIASLSDWKRVSKQSKDIPEDRNSDQARVSETEGERENPKKFASPKESSSLSLTMVSFTIIFSALLFGFLTSIKSKFEFRPNQEIIITSKGQMYETLAKRAAKYPEIKTLREANRTLLEKVGPSSIQAFWIYFDNFGWVSRLKDFGRPEINQQGKRTLESRLPIFWSRSIKAMPNWLERCKIQMTKAKSEQKNQLAFEVENLYESHLLGFSRYFKKLESRLDAPIPVPILSSSKKRPDTSIKTLEQASKLETIWKERFKELNGIVVQALEKSRQSSNPIDRLLLEGFRVDNYKKEAKILLDWIQFLEKTKTKDELLLWFSGLNESIRQTFPISDPIIRKEATPILTQLLNLLDKGWKDLSDYPWIRFRISLTCFETLWVWEAMTKEKENRFSESLQLWTQRLEPFLKSLESGNPIQGRRPGSLLYGTSRNIENYEHLFLRKTNWKERTKSLYEKLFHQNRESRKKLKKDPGFPELLF